MYCINLFFNILKEVWKINNIQNNILEYTHIIVMNMVLFNTKLNRMIIGLV